MRRLLIIFVAIGFGLVGTTPGQKISGKQGRELTKRMGRYLKAKTEEDREEALYSVLGLGRAGLLWLNEKKKKGWDDALVEIEGRSIEVLGLDVHDQPLKKKKKASPWLPALLAAGELGLARSGETLAGFVVTESSDFAAGNLEFQWWTQSGDRKKLGRGKTGKATATGKEAKDTWRKDAGYTEYDFRLEFDGLAVKLRFVGPAHFLIGFDGKSEYAVTGMKTPGNLKTTGKLPDFHGAVPAEFPKIEEHLQTYLFRILPGSEPLLLEENDSQDFENYQSVQVRVALDRPGGKPVVVVRLLDGEASGMNQARFELTEAFIRRIMELPPGNLIVVGGANTGFVGNKFFVTTAWKDLDKKLMAKLEKNFPEDF